MSVRPIQFLSIPDILRIHGYAIRDQRGDPTVRDLGLLESAMAMPKQQFGGEFLHPDIPSMAAAYGFHICKNHPFIDGNKRAATAAMLMFLSDNGWSYDATADEAEPVILSLAAGSLDKESLTTWVRAHCHEKPRLELRDFFAKLTISKLAQYEASVARTPSDLEIATTIQEAAEAIPLLFELKSSLETARTTGDVARAQAMISLIKLLVGLYRLAEDQGYEW